MKQSAALRNSKSADRGSHTLHNTDSTKHIYCIKHQKRVRNCFKPTQCFPSLSAFLPGAAFFFLCLWKGNGGGLRWHWHTRDGCWTPPAFCICHLEAVHEWGCDRPEDVHYFRRVRAVQVTDWGKRIPDGTRFVLPVVQLALHRHVEKGCSCGRPSDQGQNDQN